MASKGIKRRLSGYTVAKKMEILDLLDKKTMTRKELLEKFKLPASTLSTWISKREEIEKSYTSNNTTSTNWKRFRTSTREDLEAAVFDWFKAMRARNQPVNGPMLLEKAVALSEEMQVPFTPSNGWLHRFRERRDITYREISGESASVNVEEVEEYKSNILPKLLKD